MKKTKFLTSLTKGVVEWRMEPKRTDILQGCHVYQSFQLGKTALLAYNEARIDKMKRNLVEYIILCSSHYGLQLGVVEWRMEHNLIEFVLKEFSQWKLWNLPYILVDE